ncbi:arylesterase [Sulfuricystis multivorans]|uniref:arylesterase n=1 Tax=Sulfuricystis multivorans TaxID=2211108 RepID=UPI000F82A3D9|nr:arylesterase [Sulfuricystis multivorans]
MFRILAFFACLLIGQAHAAEKILVFGDSLSAGYGMAREQSWPALLQTRLAREGHAWEVFNASISGETTAGGKSRLPAVLQRERPRIVILALGANDGLRGLSLRQMRENLTVMVRQAKAAGGRVLLVGMQLPPNYGPDYSREFNVIFSEIAKAEKTALLPFLLEPIALDDTAFQPDRLHPTAAAQPKILDHVWAALLPLLKRP